VLDSGSESRIRLAFSNFLYALPRRGTGGLPRWREMNKWADDLLWIPCLGSLSKGGGVLTSQRESEKITKVGIGDLRWGD